MLKYENRFQEYCSKYWAMSFNEFCKWISLDFVLADLNQILDNAAQKSLYLIEKNVESHRHSNLFAFHKASLLTLNFTSTVFNNEFTVMERMNE